MRTINTTYVSICLSLAEKEALDALVKTSGKNRNRFLRDLISKAVVEVKG